MALSDLGKPDQDFDYPGFAKWIVQEPAGKRFKRRFHEEVHFTGKLLDGTVFASSKENGTPVLLTCNRDEVMDGFIRAIGSMQLGEKSIFTVPAPLALTRNGCPASIPWNIPPDQTLRFDIELISITDDILHDQSILKKIIKFGEETWWCPTGLDEVFVNYDARLKDGTSVSKSKGVEFSLREGFFCPAFAHAVKTMEKGEEAILIVKPEHGFGEQGRPSIGNEAAVPPDATLYVNLQLMSWTKVSHVGENQDIIKRTNPTQPYNCKIPHNQSVVKVRLIGKLKDGTVFDRRGHDGEEPFEFTIDEEHVIYGLDEAVMTMHEGEVASFTIPPQHAFGAAGSSNQYELALVPPNSVVIYELELLSVVDVEEHPWPRTKTTEERIEAAKIKERDGDDLFNSGKYLRAYRRYLRARQILPYHDETKEEPTIRLNLMDILLSCLRQQSDDETKEIPSHHQIKEMLISLTLKSAECAMQLQRYEQAFDRYQEVTLLDPRNAKALQMVAQPLPKSSVAIHAPSMNRGLKEYRGIPLPPPMVVSHSFSSMRLVDGHEPSGRRIVVPPVATPEANSNHASQPLISTASAPTAVHQSPPAPAPPAVSVAVGVSSTTTTAKEENRSSGTTRRWKAGLDSLLRR